MCFFFAELKIECVYLLKRIYVSRLRSPSEGWGKGLGNRSGSLFLFYKAHLGPHLGMAKLRVEVILHKGEKTISALSPGEWALPPIDGAQVENPRVFCSAVWKRWTGRVGTVTAKRAQS